MIKQTKKELEEQLAKEPKLVLNSSHRKSGPKYFGKHFVALPKLEQKRNSQAGQDHCREVGWIIGIQDHCRKGRRLQRKHAFLREKSVNHLPENRGNFGIDDDSEKQNDKQQIQISGTKWYSPPKIQIKQAKCYWRCIITSDDDYDLGKRKYCSALQTSWSSLECLSSMQLCVIQHGIQSLFTGISKRP